LDTEEGAGSVQSKHNHSENYDNASLGLEQAWHFSPAWIQDLMVKMVQRHQATVRLKSLTKTSATTTITSQTIYCNLDSTRCTGWLWFELNEHPNRSKDTADQQFLIISKTFYNQNNLPKDLTNQVETLFNKAIGKSPISPQTIVMNAKPIH
jgi:type VI secretion system secreted protein VgrG